MTTKLTNWQKFDNAFSQVSAYVVLDKETKEVVAKIALKFPKDSASRLKAYVHVIGMTVQEGIAGGYGYDKKTHAIIRAAQECRCADNLLEESNLNESQRIFLELLHSDKAQGGWQEVINHEYGFIVIQAV